MKLKETIADIMAYLLQVERKKLLWTNTQGAAESYSVNAEFDAYDEVEVLFERSGSLYSFRMRNNGTAMFVFPYGNYLVYRALSINGNSMSIGNGGYYNGYNTGTNIYGANYAVPLKVYGIKMGGYCVRQLFQRFQPFPRLEVA